LLTLLAGVGAAAQTDPVAAALAEVLRESRHPWLRRTLIRDQQETLRKIYQPRDHAPLWLEGARPTRQAAAAIAALAAADRKGLDPADYDAALLERKRTALASGRAASAGELARFEAALSIASLRMLSDLHVGRLNPRYVAYGLDAERHVVELADRLPAAVESGRVRELSEEMDPEYVMYRRLQRALATYRALAADASWRPLRFPETLHPGDESEIVPDLARNLALLGDLPAEAARPDARYGGPLVEAVRRFQTRHGLDPDGAIGPRTARALAVSPAARVRQIELSLERFRWIPDLIDARFVIVNVPAFELLARESISEPGESALSMRVVVGKAARTPTPVFIADMSAVVFRPYWNVPRSITVHEMLPKIRRDLGYLARQHMEIVASGGADVLPPTSDSVARLAAGTARLRQRPGPDNALGRVKFLLPNRYGVFLHDTPFPGIFQRSRRDFSHGCIRLEDPVGLASWVLRDRPEWTPDAIASAMAASGETRVALRDRIVVIVFYTTVIVRSDDTVWFFDDLYGHDAKLDRALADRERNPP
jgi:murein L,D-transpeptidase YcbB/YkuD